MKTLLKYAPKRASVPCLIDIHVKNNIAMITDLDFILSYPIGKEDGLYQAGALKAGAWIKSDNDLTRYPDNCLEIEGDYESFTVAMNDIDWMANAMSKEETRYYLMGINFDLNGMTATTGHVLKQVKIESGLSGKYILPSYAVKILIDLCKETKAKEFKIDFYNGKAVVIIGEYIFKTRLIDGNFPDYNRVIPKDYEKNCRFKSEDFKACDKLAAAINGKSRSIVIEGGFVKVSGQDSEQWGLIGHWDIRIGFNSSLLLGGDIEGVCHYDTAGSPIKVTNDNRTFIAMPLRV